MMDRRTFLTATPLLTAAPLLAAAAGAQAPPQSAHTEARAYVKPGPLAPWAGELEFALDPPVSEWRAEDLNDKEQVAYTGGGYRLELDFRHPEPRLLTLQFRLGREDKRPFLVRSYSVKAQ